VSWWSSFAAGFAGGAVGSALASYLASHISSHRVARREERRLGVDPDQQTPPSAPAAGGQPPEGVRRMSEPVGITESTEAIKAAGAVAWFLKQAAADGWGLDDLRDAATDENLRAKVITGVTGSHRIPGEVTDLDVREVMDLFVAVADEFEGLT
jgi:hypothetical protein